VLAVATLFLAGASVATVRRRWGIDIRFLSRHTFISAAGNQPYGRWWAQTPACSGVLRPLRAPPLLRVTAAQCSLAPSPSSPLHPRITTKIPHQAAAAPATTKQVQPGQSAGAESKYAGSYAAVYGGFKCYVDALVRPTTTNELADAVKQLRAGAAAAGKPLKIRTSRAHFHGTSTFGCPGAFGPGYGSPVPFTDPSASSSVAPSTAGVLVDALDKVLSVDRSNYQIVVQAGLRVDKLLQWAEANGMSMERGAPTTYAELTISGVIATGGHATGYNITSNFVSGGGGMSGLQGSWRGGQQGSDSAAEDAPALRPPTHPPSCRPAVTRRSPNHPPYRQADAVISFTWVDAAGQVHTSERHSDEGRAISGGFGLIGILTGGTCNYIVAAVAGR
jgi:hypothetical protein